MTRCQSCHREFDGSYTYYVRSAVETLRGERGSPAWGERDMCPSCQEHYAGDHNPLRWGVYLILTLVGMMLLLFAIVALFE